MPHKNTEHTQRNFTLSEAHALLHCLPNQHEQSAENEELDEKEYDE